MLTCETGCYEYACEAAEATYKGRTIYAPIFDTDILVFAVYTHVDQNANQNKQHNGDHFEGS